jgi:hypothetical protein
MRTALKVWLPLTTLVTFIAGMVFVVAHQIVRQSANDPQIQLTQDWADQVTSGIEPNRLSLGAFIDPARSLATFGIVYDQDGQIIASSVSAPSTMAQPGGVFDTVDAAPTKSARYTWQPASGERYAAVLQRTTFQNTSYYILAGRNLRPVEERIGRIGWIIAATWAVTVVAITVAQNIHVVARMVRRGKK